ncbi:BF3164 family lipoprotein [Algoriphagus sp.]|uniref:BF3164 family lipoprotein n=1 Tax=Algoriphagus sp. TaxID=1872435 RepID=UPI003299B473
MKNTILFVLILSSCTSPKDSKSFFNDFPDEKNIKGKYLDFSAMLNQAFDIELINNQLIVADPDEYHFKTFDLENSNRLRRFGKIGEGPCEIIFPTTIQRIGNNSNTIGLYGRKNWKYQEMNIKAIDDKIDSCYNQTSRAFNFNYQKLLKISDSLFFGTGIFDLKFAMSRANSNEFEVLDIPYPFTDGNAQSGNVPMSQQGDLILKPSGDKILCTTKYAPYFEILNINGEKEVKSSYVFEGWAPETKPNDDEKSISANLKQENKFGFISSSATNNYIYLLFSGKDFSIDPYLSDIVLVYDWEGNKIKRFNLDHEVEFITVSSDDEFLISYHDDGKPNLTRYDLDGQ